MTFQLEEQSQILATAIRSSKKFLILLHDNPDPDCIASGLILAKIAQMMWVDATVAYGGHLGRSENIKLVQTMKSHICNLKKLNFDDYDCIAMVDSQPGTGNNSLPENRSAEIVIDHHPHFGEKGTILNDIREDAGCTTVMAYNYLKALGFELDKNLATAIIYAIITETQDLGRETTEEDLNAYLEIFPYANLPLLSKIRHPKRPHTYFKDLKNALNNLYSEGTFVFSHVGEVNVTDIVPEICDLILEMEGIEWALCSGHTNDRIAISIRTNHEDAKLGHILKKIVGKKGKAGGHGMMAGGFIYLDEFSDEEYDQIVNELSMDFLKEAIQGKKNITETTIKSDI
ncbi:MAG: phosphoesterase [Planctomycetota bacterium]|nr:MAG: phosphoesterase [Planctomycetota bacterium]